MILFWQRPVRFRPVRFNLFRTIPPIPVWIAAAFLSMPFWWLWKPLGEAVCGALILAAWVVFVALEWRRSHP